jgi:hypothetical protein
MSKKQDYIMAIVLILVIICVALAFVGTAGAESGPDCKPTATPTATIAPVYYAYCPQVHSLGYLVNPWRLP